MLRLLRSDLSGPEIARELHVSLNTIRTHTKSIYTKLGATNRREAIRRAAEHRPRKLAAAHNHIRQSPHDVRRAHQVRSYGPDVSADDRTPDTPTGAPAAEHDPVPHYEIRVKGRLSPRWSAWFDGLTVETEPPMAPPSIRGPVVDQAALHGLLQKLRDVGIPLLSLTQIPPLTPTEPTAQHIQKEN